MARHRALAAFALGVLGITALPIVGAIAAIVLGRPPSEGFEPSDVTTERFRKVGRALGYIGLAVAVTAILTGVLVGLLKTL